MDIFMAAKPLDLNQLLVRSRTKIPKVEGLDCQGSVVHVWRVSETEGPDRVKVEAAVLHPVPDMLENECYLILHTYGAVPLGDAANGVLSSYDGIAKLCKNGLITCTERSLATRVTDSTSYDLYQWNGRKARSHVKSVALGKTFQLNTSLSALAARTDSLHDYLVSVRKLMPLSTDEHLQESALPLLSRQIHLFARITFLLSLADPAAPAAPVDMKRSPSICLPPAGGVRMLRNTKHRPSVATLSIISAGKENEHSQNARKLIPTFMLPSPASPTPAATIPPIVKPIGMPPPLGLKLGGMTPRAGTDRPKGKGPMGLDIGLVQGGVEVGAIDDERQRKQRKLDHFSRICSEIADRLYLCSNEVVKDREHLRRHNITHVLNTAGFILPNHHEDDPSITYRRLYLNDGHHEDIECCFYESIEFLEECMADPNGRVAVHCYQGVSRSATLLIVYLMVSQGWSYEEAYRRTRAKRGIVEPNIGFVNQLRNWEGRINNGVEVPRLYRVQVHTPQSQGQLVAVAVRNPNKPARLMMSAMTSHSLDPASAYVMHSPDGQLYVWKGKDAPAEHVAMCTTVCGRLTKYEKAKPEAVVLEQHSETDAFWALFEDGGKGFDTRMEESARDNSEAEGRRGSVASGVEEALDEGDSETRMFMLQGDDDAEELELFDMDDLLDDGVYVVFDVKQVLNKAAYVWMGGEQNIGGTDPISLARRVLDKAAAHITEVTVIADGDEPDEFWDLFVC